MFNRDRVERLLWTSCKSPSLLKTITHGWIDMFEIALTLSLFTVTTVRLSGTCIRHKVCVSLLFPYFVRNNLRGNKYLPNCPWDTRTNTRRSLCTVVEYSCKKWCVGFLFTFLVYSFKWVCSVLGNMSTVILSVKICNRWIRWSACEWTVLQRIQHVQCHCLQVCAYIFRNLNNTGSCVILVSHSIDY